MRFLWIWALCHMTGNKLGFGCLNHGTMWSCLISEKCFFIINWSVSYCSVQDCSLLVQNTALSYCPGIRDFWVRLGYFFCRKRNWKSVGQQRQRHRLCGWLLKALPLMRWKVMVRPTICSKCLHALIFKRTSFSVDMVFIRPGSITQSVSVSSGVSYAYSQTILSPILLSFTIPKKYISNISIDTWFKWRHNDVINVHLPIKLSTLVIC